MLKTRYAAAIALGLGMCWLAGAQQAGERPQASPPIPPGHPPIGQEGPTPPPPAKPEDVASVDAIVKAYYSSVSGPRGQPRDWQRLRSLFLPEAHFITTRPAEDGFMPMVLSVDQFIELNRAYFEKGGYFEDEIHRRTDTFGNIAQVFSTYESRRDREAAEPYSRGINSIQVLSDGHRWWIAGVMWDFERPDTNPIPPEYGAGGK